MPANVWAEVTGGDAFGRGIQPALSWWLPDGARVQHAYRIRTDDGLSWRLAGGSAGLEFELLVPGGTTASVVLPGEAPRLVSPGRHRFTGPAPTGLI